MDPLDKLFRKILDSREGIPYQEEYWKVMLESMDTARGRRKRKKRLWLMGGMLFLLALVIFLASSLLFPHHTAPQKHTEDAELLPMANLDQAKTKSQPKPYEENAIAGLDDSVQPHKMHVYPKENTTASVGVGPAGNTNTQTGSTAGFPDQSQADRVAPGEIQGMNMPVIPGDGRHAESADKPEEEVVVETNQHVNANRPDKTTTVLTTDQKYLSLSAMNTVDGIEPFVRSQKGSTGRQKGIDLAVYAFGFIPADSKGVSTAPGFGIGIQMEKQLSGRFSLASELGTQVQPGGFLFRKQSEQVTLAFQAEQTSHELNLQTLFQVYGALSAVYSHGRHSISSGISIQYSIAGRGEILSFVPGENTGSDPVKSSKAWVNLDGIQRLQPGLFVAYGYRIQPAVAFRISLHYSTGELLNSRDALRSQYNLTGSRSRIFPGFGLLFDINK